MHNVSYRFLSLLQNPPEGFQYTPRILRSDVRLAPFALLSPNVEEAEAVLSRCGASSAGVIVTFGGELSWRQRAPLLFHLTAPQEFEPHLVALLRSHLLLLENCRREAERSVLLSLELARAHDDGRRNRLEFGQAKECLLDELIIRKSAEERLSYSNIRFLDPAGNSHGTLRQNVDHFSSRFGVPEFLLG